MTIEEEVRSLVNELKNANSAYYDLDAPIMGDSEYDKKMRRLTDLETENPECILPDSPTKYVGGTYAQTLEKVVHIYEMKSLRDIWDDEELKSFVSLAEGVYTDISFSVEPKVDGLSIELVYENGELIRGSTRGNGKIGEDVTDNVRQISGLPMFIDCSGRVVVRGEVYLPKNRFTDINQVLMGNGEKPFATPRNTAAGTLRNGNPSLVSARGLKCVIFEIEEAPVVFSSHNKALEWASFIGFPIIPNTQAVGYLNVLKAVSVFHNPDWEFPTDGVVVKINNYKSRFELGDTSKFPKWAVARKFEEETVPTTIKSIDIQVGRTGVLTPVAKIKPVVLDGTKIQSVTLNNPKFVIDNDIRVGDTVMVTKAGGVIPRITEVLLNKRPALSRIFEFPSTCPECGSEVIQDGASLRCTSPTCPAQLARRILHFFSPGGFDVSGIGPAVANELAKAKLVSNPAEVFSLDFMDWCNASSILTPMEIKKLQLQLAKRSIVSLENYIYALGIPNVGRVASYELSRRYYGIREIASADISALATVDSIGEKTAIGIVEFLNRSDILEMIELLENEGIQTFDKVVEDGTIVSPIAYKTFCFTGGLKSMTRHEACDRVTALHGYATNRIIADGYLVVGEDPSDAKIAKAKTIGAYILDEDEFMELLF